MSASETRRLARRALTDKWGKAALITLVYAIIIYALEWVLELIPLIGNLAIIAITVPLSFGITAVFMKLKRNEEVSVVDFLTLGFNNFTGAWITSLWTFVKLLIPFIIIIVSIIVMVIGFGVSSATLLIAEASPSASIGEGAGIGIGLIGLVAMIASSIWYIVKSYSYKLAMYVLYDNPEKAGKDAVEESEVLMNGNKGKFFCLELSFIGWAILAVFTLGIGYLWLLPYMMISEIVFYEVIAGKNSEGKAEVVKEEAAVVQTPVQPTEEPADESIQEPVVESVVEQSESEDVSSIETTEEVNNQAEENNDPVQNNGNDQDGPISE